MERTNSTVLPSAERLVRSKRKAGECSGTPSASDSSTFVTVGSICFTPPAIVIPYRSYRSS